MQIERPWRANPRTSAFAAVWGLGVILSGAAVLSGNFGPKQPVLIASEIAVGLLLTATLVWALPGFSFAGQAFQISAWRFGALAGTAWIALYACFLIIPIPWSLLVLAVAASVALVMLRTLGSRREVAYAAVLAATAAAFGIANQHNLPYLPMWQWGLLQIPLTFLGLLGGWAIARRLGLFEKGIGTVHLLAEGPGRALKAGIEGMVLAVPFALLAIALGSTSTEGWATQWWAPLAAVQPAISEEAYARVFVLGFLMFMFVRLEAGALRGAWLGAVIVGVYWFASIHTKPWDVASTLLVGTLFNLPLSYVWLRRGFESAIGFHFAMDGLRWLVAFLVASGVLAR